MSVVTDKLELMQNLLDAIPHPLYYKDADGVYQGANRAFAEVLGLEPDQVTGRTVHDVVPSELAEFYHEQDLSLMRSGSTQVYEAEGPPRGDGRKRRYVFHKAPFRDARGQLAGIVGTMLEVTEPRRMTDRLVHLNLTMAGFGTDPLANISKLLALCGVTLGADVAVFNRREGDDLVTVAGWQLPAGYPRAIPVENSLTTLVMSRAAWGATLEVDLAIRFPRDRHAVEFPMGAYLGQPVRDGEDVIGAVAILYRNKREPDEQDLAFLGIVAAAVGSEERRRRAIIALQENQRQLVQSEKLAIIGQLAAGVAHEINNPVGFILSNLTTLAEYVASLQRVIAAYETAFDETPAAVAAVRESEDLAYVVGDLPVLLRETAEGAERVREIVQNLKTFARPDDATACDVDVNACLESTLKIVWNELKYRCEVVKELSPVPAVQGYPGKLNQVFMNLLVNAAQAIDGQGTITIGTAQVGDRVVIRIADTGRGMAPAVLERIFEPFYTTKAPGQGTGLGLSISLSLVELHHGTIDVMSEPGQGTTFTIALPILHD